MMTRNLLCALVLAASTGGAAAQDAPSAYRYSGQHSGGAAGALIPEEAPAPVMHRPVDPAYRYSGTHAGGPADALVPAGASVPATRRATDPAYRYPGSHAGGPADALIPE